MSGFTNRTIDEVMRAANAVLAAAPVDFSGASLADSRAEFRDDFGATDLELAVATAICREEHWRLRAQTMGLDRGRCDVHVRSTMATRPGLYILLARAALAERDAFEASR